LLGDTKTGRDHVVESARALSIIKGDWKYIEPSKGARYNSWVDIELGNDTIPQLYNLKDDISEQKNVADIHPEKTKELADLLNEIIAKGGRQ
jgi:arylsulfatase A-like enzyme